jgi:hypothetical protein
MTPQEKAEQLLAKMNVIHYLKLGGKNKDSKGLPVSMYDSQIKQCAIVAVDEIMEFMKMDDEYTETSSNANSKWVYFWKQVKEELQKL